MCGWIVSRVADQTDSRHHILQLQPTQQQPFCHVVAWCGLMLQQNYTTHFCRSSCSKNWVSLKWLCIRPAQG
jgi:hypothetical protein